MKTYMPNEATIERKWYVVDAEGCTLGRLASEIAKLALPVRNWIRRSTIVIPSMSAE